MTPRCPPPPPYFSSETSGNFRMRLKRKHLSVSRTRHRYKENSGTLSFTHRLYIIEQNAEEQLRLSLCCSRTPRSLIETTNCDIINRRRILAASLIYRPVGAFKQEVESTHLGRGAGLIINEHFVFWFSCWACFLLKCERLDEEDKKKLY